jgi:hydroxymethylpyrimidine/phosphomethylpyrimidine kinase
VSDGSAARVPALVSVAGSDPSGGAGVQADLKTASALGVYAGAVLTALTAQDTRGVYGVLPVDADFVSAQLDAVLDDLDVRAVKVGMLGSAAVVHAVADCLCRRPVPWLVVDPVMVATSGDRLVDDETALAVRDVLLPLADVLTPNLPEAATLLGLPDGTEVTDAVDAGRALRSLGARAALVKGGHATGARSVDVLVDADGHRSYDAARLDTPHTHGTGCTLSTAVAAGLVRGLPLREAVGEAKEYLTRALVAGATVRVGHGRGPVHHFHAWWPAVPAGPLDGPADSARPGPGAAPTTGASDVR